MSSANLELVRSIYEAWEQDDYSSVEWADPAIEFEMADGPDPGIWTGLDGMARGWRTFRSTWEHFSPAATEFRELDDEHVLVLVQFAGRAKTSGLDLAQVGTQQANLIQIRKGKVTRVVLYWDRRRAYADLGLTEESGTP